MPHFVCLLLGDFCNSASGIFRIPQLHSVIPCLFAHVPVVHTSVDGMGCAHSHSGQDRIRADMGPQEIWSKLKRLKLQVCSIL